MKELKKFIKGVKKVISKPTSTQKKKYRINPKLSDKERKAIGIEYKNGGGTSKLKTEEKVSIHALMEKYKASYGAIWNIIHKANPIKK